MLASLTLTTPDILYSIASIHPFIYDLEVYDASLIDQAVPLHTSLI